MNGLPSRFVDLLTVLVYEGSGGYQEKNFDRLVRLDSKVVVREPETGTLYVDEQWVYWVSPVAGGAKRFVSVPLSRVWSVNVFMPTEEDRS